MKSGWRDQLSCNSMQRISSESQKMVTHWEEVPGTQDWNGCTPYTEAIVFKTIGHGFPNNRILFARQQGHCFSLFSSQICTQNLSFSTQGWMNCIDLAPWLFSPNWYLAWICWLHFVKILAYRLGCILVVCGVGIGVRERETIGGRPQVFSFFSSSIIDDIKSLRGFSEPKAGAGKLRILYLLFNQSSDILTSPQSDNLHQPASTLRPPFPCLQLRENNMHHTVFLFLFMRASVPPIFQMKWELRTFELMDPQNHGPSNQRTGPKWHYY